MELVEEISQLPSVEIDAQQDLDDQTVMVGVVDASAESAYTALAAALERYNSLIQAQPGQYAHFLGRAKAKFLLGDRSGALEDVRTAGELDPGNVHVNTVRQKIEDGRVSEKDTYHAAVSKYMSLGNGFLEKGDIGNAYLNYSKAEQLGAKKRISAFSFAMCACLKKDLVEVERHLMQAVPPKGSYEDVSHQILRLVTRSIIDKEDVALIEMRDGLVEMLRTTAYELDVSPLRFVRAAIGSMFDQDIVANATEIFSLTVKE
jgi:tetratricopeptide (TPR) repeat protein